MNNVDYFWLKKAENKRISNEKQKSPELISQDLTFYHANLNTKGAESPIDREILEPLANYWFSISCKQLNENSIFARNPNNKLSRSILRTISGKIGKN